MLIELAVIQVTRSCTISMRLGRLEPSGTTRIYQCNTVMVCEARSWSTTHKTPRNLSMMSTMVSSIEFDSKRSTVLKSGHPCSNHGHHTRRLVPYCCDRGTANLTISVSIQSKSSCLGDADPLRRSTADSTLINGLGRYSGGPASNLAVISVTKGKR